MARRKAAEYPDKRQAKSIRKNVSASKEIKKTVKQKKNVLHTEAEELGRTLNSSRRSLRSTPLNTFDFVGDSPDPSSARNKNNGNDQGLKKVPKNQQKKVSATKSKKHKNEKNNVMGNMVTPKTRTRKAVPQVQIIDKSIKKKNDRKLLKPISQPNLEDLSPIVHETTTDKSSTDKVQRRVLRSAEKVRPAVETPSVSFIVPRSDLNSSNDSAIFVSPRRTMPRFTAEKTSTPAVMPNKTKKLTKGVLKAKNTSTPIDNKPKKQYTTIKSSKQYESPVRMETPTSDYGSMLFETPEYSPQESVHKKKRAHSPGPIFSLEDNRDSLSLNKSIDMSYKQEKRSRRKYEKKKKVEAKMEEWIEKVNSELEDIENFELSVEG